MNAMKRIIQIIAIILFLILVFGTTEHFLAAAARYEIAESVHGNRPMAAATTIVTVSPADETVEPTAESRELPPVGANAGLVIGATVLVLIIIGGVLGVRVRQKH
jgi:hypothetical protein